MIKFTLIPYFISKAESVRTELVSISLFTADPEVIKLSQLITLQVEKRMRGVFFLKHFISPAFIQWNFSSASTIRLVSERRGFRHHIAVNRVSNRKIWTCEGSRGTHQSQIPKDLYMMNGTSPGGPPRPYLSVPSLILGVFFSLLLPLHLHWFSNIHSSAP